MEKDFLLEEISNKLKADPNYLTKLKNFVINYGRKSERLPFQFQTSNPGDNILFFPVKKKATREFIVTRIIDQLSCLDQEGLELYNKMLTEQSLPNNDGDDDAA